MSSIKVKKSTQAVSYNWRTLLFIGLGLLWAMCIPGFNIYHHLELPDLSKYKYTITTSTSYGAKQFNIQLTDEIKEPQFYETIQTLLRQASSRDTITFHLIGPGGRADSFYYLANNIKASKAKIVMSVEGPAYSADAYLATIGDELKMARYSLLMFHFSSILNLDCSTEVGTDRGVSNIEHCQAMKDSEVAIGTDMVNDVKILKSDEKAAILTGHDVYLTPDQVNERQALIAQNKTVEDARLPNAVQPVKIPAVTVPEKEPGAVVVK